MKKLLFVMSLLVSLNSFAEISFEGSTDGNLDKVEIKKVRELLTKLANERYEGNQLSVSVDYYCSTTPMMKVYCATSITNAGGTVGAAVVTYDRYQKTAVLSEHTIGN